MSIVLINGSPSRQSRGAILLERASAVLARWDIDIRWINIRELPAEALLKGHSDDLSIQDAIQSIRQAHAIVIATPVYKAAYSGLLKIFIDVLPRDAFDGKTLLPLATGGSTAHALVIDYALRPVLAALHPYRVVNGVFAADSQFLRNEDGQHSLDPDIAERLDGALVDLLADLDPLELPRSHRTAEPTRAVSSL